MQPLNIGFDAKRVFNNRTGLGVYGRNLIRNFAELYPDNRYYLFTPSVKLPFELPNKNVEVVSPRTSFKSLWRTWGINGDIRKRKIDIYHGLSNEIPFTLNPATRYITTVHDLIWLRLPETYKSTDRFIYTRKLEHACKHSSLLVATSQQTADDLQELMGVPKDKIRVVYQTGGEVPDTISLEPPLAQPYFFYLSSFEKRKNHLRLLQAYLNARTQTHRKLVLAGKEGETLPLVRAFIAENGLQEDVKILTDLSEQEKFVWLKHADAFVYPSACEGFGIPLLEAVKAGTPLILNNLPVFREIAEETAVYFSVNEPDSLENALLSFDYTAQKAILQSQQPVLLEKFSPENTSRVLRSVYEEVLG